MIPAAESDIIARAALAAKLKDPRNSGLLFHGTAEPFAGAPTPGGDGLLWFADNPLFAQAYIPEAGISAYVSKPSDWRMTDRVRPDRHSFWTEFAVNTMGRPLPDVEYDDFGMALSWSIPAQWPTYSDCFTALRSLGYAFLDGHDQVKYADGPNGPVARSDWYQTGRVLVTAVEGLKLLDRSSGEGDLTEKAHLEFDMFRAAQENGYDGVAIDDFAQSSDSGNVGHRAVGLFATTVERLEFISYDAIHRPMRGLRSLGTPDFETFAAEYATSAPGLASVK